MTQPIRVLHVDDEPDFADMAATFLERENDRFDVETATSTSEGLSRLAADEFDCIVSDYDMPGQNGIEFLEAVREEYPDLPFILYTGKGSEEVASDAISAGVTDYLQKGNGTSQYTVLANRIANAVEKYRSQRGLEASQKRLSLFIDQSSLGVIEWDENFNFVRMNDAAEDLLGYSPEDLDGESWEVIVPEDDRDAVADVVADLLENQGGYHSINENVRKDGERIICEWHNRVVTDESGDVVAIFSQFQDITERKEREWAVEELHTTARELMQVKTTEDVADVVVEAVDDVLDMPANAVHFYDDREGGLVPVAWTEYGEELVGDVPTIPRDDGLAWEVFESGEPEIHADVSKSAGRFNPDTEIRSEIILPLGDYGVALIGSSEPDMFDEVDVSLAQTLTIHATTALDRLDRERELARQRSLLEAQQERVLDGMLVVDEEGEIISYNDRFAEMWGIPREIVERGDDDEALDWVTDHLANPGEFYEKVDYLYEHPQEIARDEIELTDGRVFDRYTAPLTGDDGTYYGRLWTFRDITERKERERELKRNERIIQKMNDGVVVVQDELITYTNPRISELTGYTPEELHGQPMGEFIAPDDRDTVQQRFRDRIAGKDPPSNYQISILSKDEETVPVEITVERIEYDGQPATVSIVRDIADRRERERELKRQNEQLEEFANIVSHDLRSPLNVAEGHLELVDEECDSEHLDAVARSHDRMEALIDDLLTLAREGKRVENTESVDFAKVTESCWRNVDTSEASLIIDTDRAIRADQSRLQQLLENLVRNTIEHGDDDVTVTVGEIDDKGFYVEDDGPGIPEDTREQVFERGYSTSGDGTGFGLNIVEQIAEAHEWNVRVTDSEAGGARFEITGVELVD